MEDQPAYEENKATGGEMTFWATQLVSDSPRNTSPNLRIKQLHGIRYMQNAFQFIVLFIMVFLMFNKDVEK